MTSPSYLRTHRLNMLRKTYFGGFGSEQCDEVNIHATGLTDVLAFSRGCTDDAQVFVLANFNNSVAMDVTVTTPFAEGTPLIDAIPGVGATQVVAGVNGTITVSLRKAASHCFLRPTASCPGQCAGCQRWSLASRLLMVQPTPGRARATVAMSP